MLEEMDKAVQDARAAGYRADEWRMGRGAFDRFIRMGGAEQYGNIPVVGSGYVEAPGRGVRAMAHDEVLLVCVRRGYRRRP